MKKNIKIILLFFITILTLATRYRMVYADMIYEPDDSFYNNNRNNMNRVRREFKINSPDGHITVYKSPNSKKKIATFDNGSTLFIYYTYTTNSGTKWGVIERFGDTSSTKTNNSNRYTGWVKMDHLVLVYDDISFNEDHQDEFNTYNNEFDSIKEKENLLLWTYPGSGVIKRTLTIASDSYPEFSHTYTDQNGRVWGNIGYYMGKGGWLCFSSPMDENLPKIDYESDELNKISQDEYDKLSSNHIQNEKMIFILAIILVSGLVTTTILLIRRFWPSNNINNDNNK